MKAANTARWRHSEPPENSDVETLGLRYSGSIELVAVAHEELSFGMVRDHRKITVEPKTALLRVVASASSLAHWAMGNNIRMYHSRQCDFSVRAFGGTNIVERRLDQGQ